MGVHCKHEIEMDCFSLFSETFGGLIVPLRCCDVEDGAFKSLLWFHGGPSEDG